MISSYLAHYNPQAILNNNTRIKTNLNYDHVNRLLEVYKTINDADSTKRLVSRNVYDQLGQVKQKQLGQLPTDGSFLETQDYSYNIRGWLKGINKDYANNDNSHSGNSRWFGLELSYDWGFGTNQLNGNIGGNKWRSKGDGQQRAYGFGYDGANRLLYGDFNQYGSSWDRTAGVDFSMMMGNGTDPTTAYDENGNIKAMLQSGWQLGGSHPIDSLSYTYYNHSNKLQNVIDGRNDTATKLEDFRTSALSPYAIGKTSAAVDYSYDVNGNLTRDLNKDIGSQTTDGIIYNHLNLPWQVKVRSATGTKGTITYIYDATGTKLEKLTMDSAGGAETTTAYIGQFQYQGKKTLGSGTPADTLLFFGQEEGRVRVVSDTTGGQAKTGFKYDYFIKDHLGNTRMVLTEEQQTDLYPAATMEVADSALENLYYSNLANTRVDISTIGGYPADTTTKPNDKVAQLSGSTGGQKVGPGIVLKVMAGDQFNIQASSWYQLMGAAPGTPANPITDLLSALISGVGGLPGGGHPSSALLSGNSAPLSSNITEFLSDTGSLINSSKPHAFVNWVLFDDQFSYVKESSGFDQVGGDQEFKKHKLLNLPVTKSGYLYIYVSNETPNVPVFFDNLQVSHVRGPLLEEDHYYPFGLTMAGISDKALKSNYAENKYRYNKGSELQNKEFSDGSGLELYTTNYRMFDPQLVIFRQIDPLADINEDQSTYSYAQDNPVLYNDPLGLLSDSSKPQVLATATVTGHKNSSSTSSGVPILPFSATRAATDNVPVGMAPRVNPSMRFIPADVVNKAYSQPAYGKGTTVTQYRTTMKQKFVRVFNPKNGNSPQGKWMMKESEIQGLTPEQIQSKFALPGQNAPSEMLEVEVPAGTLMQVGYAGTNAWGTGGGVQFELMEAIPGSSFGTPMALPVPSVPMEMPGIGFPEEPILPEGEIPDIIIP